MTKKETAKTTTTTENPNLKLVSNLPQQTENSKTKSVTVLPQASENSKSQSVGFLDSGEKVVQYHLAAERCGNLSVWCAAMAGAEIIAKKKEFGHGKGFTEWRDALPFSNKTAANYMHLAQQLESRLNALPPERRAALLPAIGQAQQQTENLLDLLNLPSPMDVFNPAHEQISEIIRDVTTGKTITQLYFDWDICKPERQLGGNPSLQKWLAANHPRVHATTPDELPKKIRKEYDKWIADQNAEAAKNHDPVKEAQETALRKFLEIKAALYDFMRRHYADLPRKQLLELKEMLGDYSREADAALQG